MIFRYTGKQLLILAKFRLSKSSSVLLFISDIQDKVKICRKDGLKLNYSKKRIRNLIPSIPVKINLQFEINISFSNSNDVVLSFFVTIL